MQWRSLSALSLIVLGLLLAAPLTAGDKGLWLSLHGSSVSLLQGTPGAAAPEHSTLLPDRPARMVAAARLERPDPARSLNVPAAEWLLGPAERWQGDGSAPVPAPHLLLAARPDPRAPPA
jgi:hypothetical protein